MLHAREPNKIFSLVAFAVLGLLSSIAIAIPDCSQNFMNKEDIICKNVQFVDDLRGVGQRDWKQLKIINEKLKRLEWNESPEEIQNVEILDLSQVGELVLAKNGFDNMLNLRNLNVSGCKMESLKMTFPSETNKLQSLDASWNMLDNLNAEMKNQFPSLEIANFSHNEIQSFNRDMMFPKLKILRLDFNQLQTITLHGYTNLNVFTASGNSIENLTVNTFKHLQAMEDLIITYCPLNHIDERTFESMKELKNLNLSSNSLEQMLPDVFAGLNNLVHLDLSSNNIEELAHLQFQHLIKLQYLDISHNSLKVLNSSNFNNLANLRKLLIHENDIKIINSNTFANLLSLDTLDLSNNNIENLDVDAFGTQILPRLRKLLLKSNNLKSLHPLSFASLPFLQYLSLGFNELESLDVRMFAPLRRLEKLHLGNNLIETITSDVLESLTDVKELLLDNNRLTYLSNSNATFSQLEKVSLEGNPWQCPCWDEMAYWLEQRNVSYIRHQSPYFKGKKPLCVVTPVDFCVKDLRLVKKHKIEEIYNSG